MAGDRIERFWERAWARLEADDPDGALAEAERMLGREPDLPEALYMAGVAHLGLDQSGAARTRFERTVTLAPEWPDAILGLAWSHFRLCAFSEAGERADAARALDPSLADAHYLCGLLAERAGDAEAANRAFDTARRIDPERYPRWPVLGPEVFQGRIESALTRLPRKFRDALDNMAIVLDPVPPLELLTVPAPPHDPEILGIFVGVPRSERMISASSGELPDMIHLFQRNIERHAGSEDELEREIAITLYHEIAHAFGFEEDEMEDLGLE